jgi:hypothetical protein
MPMVLGVLRKFIYVICVEVIFWFTYLFGMRSFNMFFTKWNIIVVKMLKINWDSLVAVSERL